MTLHGFTSAVGRGAVIAVMLAACVSGRQDVESTEGVVTVSAAPDGTAPSTTPPTAESAPTQADVDRRRGTEFEPDDLCA
ncbi:MAG: hypothetical protein HKN44_13865 [Ilumatobacter sp.]|nr:hypothetical protein [Ilumatobacter sp.]